MRRENAARECWCERAARMNADQLTVATCCTAVMYRVENVSFESFERIFIVGEWKVDTN